MRHVLIIGNYGSSNLITGGQTIRTNAVTESVERYAKDIKTIRVNTSGNKVILILKMAFWLFLSHRIVVMVGRNGLSPLVSSLCRVGLSRKVILVAIGGWLPDLVASNASLLENLSSIKAVLVQTGGIKQKLREKGIERVRIFPNYRNPSSFVPNLDRKINAPIKLVYCSRICKEKGIETAVSAVEKFNSEYGHDVYLDVYGPVHKLFKRRFDILLEDSPHIRYMGELNRELVIRKLSEYDCMLFPTFYEGEGFPGAILEAFMAGIPVIASRWKYNNEIIDEGRTGLLFDPLSVNGLVDAIAIVASNIPMVESMRFRCFLESRKYDESRIVQTLLDSLM